MHAPIRTHPFADKQADRQTDRAGQDWQDCQQEEVPPWQEVTLDRSSSEGPQGTQDQGFRSYQEGHSALQEGQGVLQPVSSKSMRSLLQMWGFLRLSSAGASVLESFGINDEGCIPSQKK